MSVYVKNIRNIKKTMQQIIGKGLVAVLEEKIPYKEEIPEILEEFIQAH